MNLTVSGKHISVGDALRSHIEKQLSETFTKYLDRVTNAHVVVTKDAHLFRADITANAGTTGGVSLKSRGESEDVYAACEDAIRKIEKQLRRYKQRLTNHHKQPINEVFSAKKYILPPTVAEGHDDHAGVIIAEKPETVQHLTVSEAVMKMDLADLPALLFFNKANGRVNVVYRRVDGNISWVDPEGMAA